MPGFPSIDETARRHTIQQLYIRVCRDSGFGLDSIRAAILTGNIVGCSPLEVWTAMPSLSVMDEIASGTHPSAPKAET